MSYISKKRKEKDSVTCKLSGCSRPVFERAGMMFVVRRGERGEGRGERGEGRGERSEKM